MKAYLDRLNLRPFEQRLLVAVVSMVFLVLNVWVVFPHFSDWSRFNFRMRVATDKLAKFNAEIAQVPMYQRRIDEFKGENKDVPPEDQALQFTTEVNNEAARSGVILSSIGRIQISTNSPFFLEQSESVRTQSREDQLVDFLFRLGSGGSLIRVRELSVNPDPPHQQLLATIRLVASYQKKKPVHAGSTSSTPRSTFNRSANPAPSSEKPKPHPMPVKPTSGPGPMRPFGQKPKP